MKIDVVSNVQQTKTELDEKFFSIADPAFIFDLLRNKIYSDPISAVCREVACNGLDAQREIGKGDVPVRIQLPTYEDLYFKVKDCGPGISPERMENIFLKYAASTKRNDNLQIGGFGIGAKSPFSYSDSFTIVTNVDGKCYNYAAFIDESRIGKLILLNETDTVEPNGTEIIVPVKSHDINLFANATEACTRHWKVKPVITGRQISWTNVDPVISGNGWFMSTNVSSYYTRNIKVLVGEIEYSLDLNSVKQFANLDVMNAFQGDLYLKFNVGEVGLAANRETIYLDPETKEAVKNRIALVKEEYVSIIKDKVNSCPSLYDANCFVSSELSAICQNTSVVGSLKWNDIPVTTEIRNSDDITAIAFTRKNKYGVEKISRTYTNGIRFSKKSKIIIHDCGEVEPSTRHVKKFFEENPQMINLYVVSPGKDVSMSDMMSTYYLDQMNLEMLSKHNANIKSKKAASTTTRMIVFKFNPHDGSFGMSSAADVKADVKQKVIVFLEKDTWRQNTKIPLRKDKVTRVSNGVIASLCKMDNEIAIYGVDKEVPESRIKDVFGSNFKYVDDQLDTIINQNSREFLLETVWADKQRYAGYDYITTYADQYRREISDQSCQFMEFVNTIDQIINITNSRRDYMNTMNKLGLGEVSEQELQQYIKENNKSDLAIMWSSVMNSYPMLEFVDRYSISRSVNKVIDYINLINSSK